MKKVLFSFLTVLLCLFILTAFYGFSVFQRYRDFYGSVRTPSRGWSGHVHRANPELGFAPVPNSRGAHLFPIGPEIPMRYDADGFRIPVEDAPAQNPSPSLVALGCSFTYGDGVRAEDTFAYQVGQSLDLTVHNAGIGSYGLAQMLILARKWVPVYKPRYTIVQYSPWLTDRAVRPFAPTYFGKLPSPYFFDQGDGFAIHPPVFLSNELSLPLDEYRNKPATLTRRISFLIKVGVPFFVEQDIQMLFYSLRRLLGRIPPGTARQDELVKYVYAEISKIAEQNQSKMVIVILGRNARPVPVRRELFPPNALIVEAHQRMLEALPHPDDEAYRAAYAHWRGNPPALVDEHPNPAAHRIIAQEITKKIQETGAVQ